MAAGAPSSGSSVARPDLPVVQRHVIQLVGRGDFGSALAKSAARGSAGTPATSTMMIMVTTPVSVVTYAIVAGES